MSEPSGLQIHPMDQFVVRPAFGTGQENALFTNAALWMVLTVLVIAFFMVWGSRRKELVPGRMQSISEVIYGFGRNIVEENAGKEAMVYFPLIMTIFLFILFANLLGLLPYSFSSTSHIAVTAFLGFGVFIFVTLLGFMKNGIGFLKLFWVESAPLVLRVPLALIEVISYFARPVSHSIRLAGNIMAGHAVMKVFAGFAGVMATASFGIGGLVPALSISALYGLELLVALIQAYVFTILTCIYLHDAYHPGH